jgi:hypothetical protein
MAGVLERAADEGHDPWLNQLRRLRVRYGKRADRPRGFSVSRLCVDLLAVPAKALDDGINGAVFPFAGAGFTRRTALRALSRASADGPVQPLRPLAAEAPSKAAIPVRTTGF